MFNFSLNCQLMNGSTSSLLCNVCIPEVKSCSWNRPLTVTARVRASVFDSTKVTFDSILIAQR